MSRLDPSLFVRQDGGRRRSTGTASYGQRLYTYAEKTTRSNELHVLEHKLLHRINIFHLQNELARLRGTIAAQSNISAAQLEELRVTLHDYTDAIRDHLFLKDFLDLKEGESDDRRRDAIKMFPEIPEEGFHSHTKVLHLDRQTDPLRRFLMRALPRKLTWTAEEKAVHGNAYFIHEPPEWVSPFVDRTARLLVALLGGLSLIGPMLIMSLPRTSPTKSLITTSVAVSLFALIVSLVFKSSNEYTVVATATYAAVLFVFVAGTA